MIQDIASVEGLSHVVLSASSAEAYEACKDFYIALGFRTAVNDSASKPAAEQSAPRHDRETWLYLAGGSSAQEIKLKLVLVSNTHKTPVDFEQNWRTEDIYVTVVTKDISSIESFLQSRGIVYKQCTYPDVDPSDLLSPPSKPETVHREVYAHDPSNNLICFTNKPNPFSNKLFYHLNKTESETTPAILPPMEKRRRRIGVLTSGGDSPGMNPAVRAIVRVAVSRGCDCYAIFEGYEGMVRGGNMIKEFGWADVRGYLTDGGTTIGTARCKSFIQRDGRLRAAANLVKNGIDALVVIGGDGTLTGADVLRSEWPGLLEELVREGTITEDEASNHSHLTIVGLVGSIDNDMASTDITIGAVTSLHRICEAVDSISSTAASHSRAFVIEVMGRSCGWLAVMAAISTGADYVFVPELPPEKDDWESDFCEVLKRHRSLGKRKTIVIVAEGAIDKNLNPIKTEYIKEILTKRMNLDTRVTALGHTQRGGRPCAFDRNLATLQGVKAVESVLRATAESPSPIIGLRENKITTKSLMEAVELTHEAGKAIREKNFRRAMELRNTEFSDDLDIFASMTVLKDQPTLPEYQRMRIAIVHIGAPAGGMNAATRAAARFALAQGHTPIAICNGFLGLLQDNVHELTWLEVEGWTAKGGSELGTNRTGPEVDIGMVAYQLQKLNINALLLIGGFEAYAALLQLNAERDKYPAFCIPMVCLPATISNNVPGTEFSLGSDTALNAIVDSCDAIKQSATASSRRVFVVEVHGGHCGYLAVMAGLAVGAASTYIPEKGIGLVKLQDDLNYLVRRFGEDKKGRSSGRLILRNECVSDTYTTQVMADIIKTEGRDLFDCRTCVLGHTQQGVTSSPLDRIRATRLAVRCISFLEKHALPSMSPLNKMGPRVHTTDKESVALIGIKGAQIVYTPVVDLLPETDMKLRKSKKSWWLSVFGLVELLSKWGYAEQPADESELFRELD